MSNVRIILLLFLTITLAVRRPVAIAADTAIATFNLSGTVPTFFAVATRGIPGDIDLTPNGAVNGRRIGLLHFKYNVNVASITISSNTASGGPEGSTPYSFQGGGFKVFVGAGCASVDPVYNAAFVLTQAGTDVKSPTAAALTQGIEEDCEVLASWQGTNQALPLAGVYALTLRVSMVSQ